MKIAGQSLSGIKRSGAAMIPAVVFLCFGVCFARLDRIDIFDKADNKLLFVTFQYDASGKNTGREVFTADSTFLRHTSLQFNTQGQITKETSINFDSNLVFNKNISISGNSTTFSVFDQFNLDQFGGPITSTTSDQVSYDIGQGGTVINKIKYTLVGGSVQRIDICDNTGAMLYYALPFPAQPGSIYTDRQISAAQHPAVASLGRGHFKITCHLAQPSSLTFEVFDISGRRAAVVLNKQYGAGAQSIIIDAAAAHLEKIGNGAYVVQLSIDGKHVVTMLSIIRK